MDVYTMVTLYTQLGYKDIDDFKDNKAKQTLQLLLPMHTYQIKTRKKFFRRAAVEFKI